MANQATTSTVAELCRRYGLSEVETERTLTSLQNRGLVAGLIPDDVHAPIALTAEAGKLKTMTVAEMCRRIELSVETVEQALASLQEKGLVTGFISGDGDALIIQTAEAAKIES
ncbi:hypothetical protein ACYSUW_14865 [Pseudomonas frederiksbergensis]